MGLITRLAPPKSRPCDRPCVCVSVCVSLPAVCIPPSVPYLRRCLCAPLRLCCRLLPHLGSLLVARLPHHALRHPASLSRRLRTDQHAHWTRFFRDFPVLCAHGQCVRRPPPLLASARLRAAKNRGVTRARPAPKRTFLPSVFARVFARPCWWLVALGRRPWRWLRPPTDERVRDPAAAPPLIVADYCSWWGGTV